MPKFTIEFDTEEKTTQILMDGNPIGATDYNISHYHYTSSDGEGEFCDSVSFSIKQDNNSSVGYSYFYDSRTEKSVLTDNAYSFITDMGKCIQRAMYMDTLSKAISKKPFKTVHFSEILPNQPSGLT